jgi:hypothetical protein
MKVIAQRPKHLLTLLGAIRLERPYYYHGRCHSQAVPLDDRLGVGASSLSPGLEAALCLTSAHLPFTEAADLVERLSGVAVSTVTVQQVAEAVGEEIAAQQQAEQAAAWAGRMPVPSKHVPERLYLGLDGINIHHLDGWHEMKVAVCYEVERQPPTPKQPEGVLRLIDPTYLATQAEAREFGKAVWVEAAKRGVEQAQELVILGDGAAWIWNIADSQFGPYRRVEIVDWYHATQHVWTVGRALYGESTQATREWVEARLKQLWEGDFDAMLKEFKAAVAFRSSATETVTDECAYFETNRARMRYAEFRAGGYQIGSGSVESACKRVVAARLKQAGMIWSARGANAIAHLRALVLSRRWDAFWRQRRPPARHYRRQAA